MSDITEESSDYLRFVYMYIDLATECVLNVFIKCSPNNDAVTFLKSEETTLKSLKDRKVLNKQEFDTVLARPLDVNQFDIALLITLAINVFTVHQLPPPKRGWYKDPRKGDMSVAADLLRLRRMRNVIVGHRSKARLEKQEFEDNWKKVSDILLRLQHEVDPTKEVDLQRRIEEYRTRRLDSCNNDKYDKKLKEWFDDISAIQKEVEDLAKKLEGFDVYFRTKSDRYERYIKLLLEGGLFVLQTHLKIEVEKQGTSLSSILKSKEDVLTSVVSDKEVLRKLYSTESENSPNEADEIPSDITLLANIIIHAVDTNDAVKQSVKSIKDARDNYIEAALTALDSDTFEDELTDLKASIQVIASFLPKDEKSRCFKKLEECKKKKDDSDSFKTCMNALQSQGLPMKSFKDIYLETLEKTKDVLQRMVADGTDFITDRVLKLKIITLGTNHEKEKLAEDVMTEVWNEAIERSDDKDNFQKVREEVNKILAEIKKAHHVKKVAISRECIVLHIPCSTPEKMLSLISYFESTTFQETLENIWTELGYCFNTAFRMFSCLPIDSLHETVFSQETEPTGLSIPITVSSPAGMLQLKSLLKSERVTNCTNTIADALSTHFEDTITLEVTLDLNEFSNVFDDMQTSESSSNSDGDSGQESLILLAGPVDINERFRFAFHEDISKAVDNPCVVVDYIECLNQLDKSVILDAWRQHSVPSVTWTDILLDRLMKHPNWLDDTIRALRDPRVELFSLADAFQRFTLTVPVHWTICSDKDLDDGINIDSLFKQVGSDKPENGETAQSAHVQTETSQLFGRSPLEMTTTNPTVNVETEPVKPNTERHYNETVNSRILPDGEPRTDISRVSKGQNNANLESETDERLGKKDIHAKMMEKIYSRIHSPKDLPIAVYYMKKMNLHMDKVQVARDRVTFNICICSLDALKTLEQLWRHGGLKRLLDKEMLDQFMLMELRSVAVKAGHPVDNLQSHLEVDDVDIERCRSSLVKSCYGYRAIDVASIRVLSENWRSKETMFIREVAINAIECLPDELKHMLEDTFVSDRVSRFFESTPVRQKFKNEHEGGFASFPKSIAHYFTEWLNDEIVMYLTDLDNNTKQHLLIVAAYLISAAETKGTVAIPSDVMSETFIMREVKTSFPSEEKEHGYWGDLIKLPSEIAVVGVTLHSACKGLMTKNVLRRSKSNISFLSQLVRDVFIAKVISCTNYKGRLKTISYSFEYVQTLIGLFEMDARSTVSDEIRAEISACAFKTNELREIGIPGKHKLTVDSNSSFYNKDLVTSRPGTVEVTDRISYAGEKIKRRLKANAYTKHISVDISDVVDDVSCLNAALHWLNTTTRRPFEKGSVLDIGEDGRRYDMVNGLAISNCSVSDRTLRSVGMYVNVTPSLSVISFKKCQLKSNLLRNVINKGLFRNIKQLNISDIHDIFRGRYQQIGLMNMPSLERFEIQNCSLGDDGLKVLAMDLYHLEKIRELNIANNRITYRGLLALKKALSKNRWISSLRLHRNYIGVEGSSILASLLESLLLLEVLNISECGIGDKGSSIIANALVSKSLMKLSMRSNGLTPKGSRDFFKYLQRPEHLNHLDFSENTLFAVSDGRDLVSAEDLSGTQPDDPFLQFLQHQASMSHLSLWNTCVGQKRLFKDLQIISCFEDMTYLCLQENDISDGFAKDVANCICTSRCCYLQHLNMRQNLIGNKGAIDIAGALSKQKYLKEVLLDRNEIGYGGANQIVSNCITIPFIERIDLSCNNLSPTDLKDIITGMAERIHTKQDKIPQYEYTPRAVTDIICQPSVEEMCFNIKRDGEKILITM